MDVSDVEFYAGIDRITTITQVLLYDVLQESRSESEELCQIWYSTLLAMESLWQGTPLSTHRKLPSYAHRIAQLKRGFQPLLELAESVTIR